MSNDNNEKLITMQALKEVLERNFQLILENKAIDSESAFFKYLQGKLAERIKLMINSNMDNLLQALYRIDIDDRETDEAFALGEIHQVSMRLAELIIVRQLQKLDYSKKFSGEDWRE